jgi:protein ImuB
MAPVPDDPPLSFRWRRVVHRVAAADGPERIGPEWWLSAAPRKPRDYYRVEDAEGRRFWLYREGLYGGAEPPRWFLHGFFA